MNRFQGAGKRPGRDPSLSSRLGTTRDGQPLSFNRQPASDLLPWVSCLYAASVKAPDNYRLNCRLFNDASVIRIQLQGVWTAESRDGLRRHERSALLFGPQSKAMPVSVTGSFASVGIAMRPGACFKVLGKNMADFVDRIVDAADFGLPGGMAMEQLDLNGRPEDWLSQLENSVREFLGRLQPEPPDRETLLFERLTLTDPNTPVADFAAQHGIDQRKLERLVRRDFGMAPKQVLRRARALDMASHLRGVADAEEAAEVALRYYDQSHLIRDFIELFGMSPKQFVQTPQPLLTSALESRQAWRLFEINRLAPGDARPWG